MFVRLRSPARKKADSRFSRKLAPRNPALAVSEILLGGAPFGGAPPAMTATRAGSPWAKLVGSLNGAARVRGVSRARESTVKGCIIIIMIVTIFQAEKKKI